MLPALTTWQSSGRRRSGACAPAADCGADVARLGADLLRGRALCLARHPAHLSLPRAQRAPLGRGNGRRGMDAGLLPAGHARRYHRYRYNRVFITGGPIDKGEILSEFKTYPELAAASVLIKLGMSSNEVVIVPSPDVPKDRTYASAIALGRWWRSHPGTQAGQPHKRRSARPPFAPHVPEGAGRTSQRRGHRAHAARFRSPPLVAVERGLPHRHRRGHRLLLRACALSWVGSRGAFQIAAAIAMNARVNLSPPPAGSGSFCWRPVAPAGSAAPSCSCPGAAPRSWATPSACGAPLARHEIAVVCAGDDAFLRGELDRLGLSPDQRIFNPAPDEGMFSSVQCAARWTGWVLGLEAWAIVLGDQPHLRLETLRFVPGVFSSSLPTRSASPRAKAAHGILS